MKKERDNTKVVLIEIQYDGSLNTFECEYGDFISYQEIEQKSYIEFKEVLFCNICRDIKFRKFGRIGQVLTIKADMLNVEIDQFKKMLGSNQIKLVHNWVVSNVTIITDSINFDEKDKKMKFINEIDEEDKEDSDLD